MAKFKRFKTDSSEELAEYLESSIKEIIYVIEDLKDNKLIFENQYKDLNRALDELVDIFSEVSDNDFNMVIGTAPLMSSIE